jgi:quinoprotein glucose dehydrogenase
MWGTKFRAYDKATGRWIWEIDLEIGTTRGPMTYMHEGRQYIVVPSGASQTEPEWIALALPRAD